MGHGHEPIGRVGRRETAIDLRIDQPEGQPEVAATAGNSGIVPPGKAEGAVDPGLQLPELKDGFVPEPMPDLATTLHGEGPPITKGVMDIVPDLTKMNALGQIPERFAADLILLRAQLSVPGIPLPEQTDRLFQFYVKYAERFVDIATAVEAEAGAMNHGDPGDGEAMLGQFKSREGAVPKGKPSGEVEIPQLEGLWGDNMSVVENLRPEAHLDVPRPFTAKEVAREIQNFTHVLKEAGFSEFHDARTGRDGTQVAAQLLKARTPDEVRERATRIELRPVHDVVAESRPAAITVELAIQQTVAPEVARQAPRPADDAQRPIAVDGRPELRAVQGQNGARVQTWAVAASQVVLRPDEKPDRPEESFGARLSGTTKRLGARMLWNVLHTFRGDGDDSTLFQSNWDKLTFGAILLLVGVALAVIALVSL